jgi:hypothetical protein
LPFGARRAVLKALARLADRPNGAKGGEAVTTIIVIVVALAVATVHLFVSKKPRTGRRAAELYLLYTLVVGVGVGGLFGAMGHLFAADTVAEQLGWPTGSPFQTEVGLFDLAFGVLGVCCIRFRGQWWYAVTLGWTIFAVGAGVNHLYEMSGSGNNGSLNAGSVLPDLIVPVLLVALLIVRYRRGGAEPSGRADVSAEAEAGA